MPVDPKAPHLGDPPRMVVVEVGGAGRGAGGSSLIAPKQTIAQRIRGLQAEAKQLAKDHIRALATAIVEVERISAEIAEGGDAYPPGVRDLARRMAEDAEQRVQTLEAITARTL